jgi:hypothetical protein
MGAAYRPVYEDLIALGDDAVDLEMLVRESYQKALVVSEALRFVQHGYPRIFPCVFVR